MLRALALLLALLYCFPWLRIPDVGGVALPFQRVLAWLALWAMLGYAATKRALVAGPAARAYLRVTYLFVAFLGLHLVRQALFGEPFYLLYFLMDFSKYLAIFTVGYLVYYALRCGLLDEERFVRAVQRSGAWATALVFLFLGLYVAGFRTANDILAPSFGGALGVWPTGGRLPRLSGTAAEPQQLAVLLLTPVLLMLEPASVRRYWPVAALGTLALLLSQSKYAVLSVLIILGYVFLVYRRQRALILLAAMPLGPVAAILLARLPVFSETLSQGLQAHAFVERFQNLVLLADIIRDHFLFGIGAGHYGVYRGIVVFGDPMYLPGYSPNMDFLKVFAETGALGFVLLLVLLGSLVRRSVRGYRAVPPAGRPRYLAFLFGMLGILGSMAIGYELLHVFFWINVGALMHLAETAAADGARA
ncbi:MAG TPA: O-antigen ligase family protein [Gemmatimonadales bacterium]|nr:O-antigen ligase family protein [Gemmatimonadales bacterium]